MNDYYVYMHRKADDGRVFYIGMGRNKRAWIKGNRSQFWTNTAKKHGYTVHIVCDGLTRNEAAQKEIYYIGIYGRIEDGSGCLVNLLLGGQASKHAESTKKKIGDKNRGRKHTPEALAKIKANAVKFWTGKPFPATMRKNISAGLLGRFLGGKNPNAKAVIQMNSDGRVVAEFDCGRAAAASVGGSSGNISSVCSGRLKTAYGYLWRYKT